MENNMKLMTIINEALNTRWPTFLRKLFVKLAGNEQIEDAFVRDLERLHGEGKVVYDKLSKKLSSIDFDKLDDDDYKLLMRSSNLRKALLDTFDEMNIRTDSPQSIYALGSKFKKIWNMYSSVPASKVIKGTAKPVNVNIVRVISKSLSDFFRKNAGSVQKLFKIYDASMQDFIALEKQIDDKINDALGKMSRSERIYQDVKEINGLILRIRDFNKKHPKIFWDNIKSELAKTPEGQTIIKEVEGSKYFTIFRERFLSQSPSAKRTPNNTVSRFDGLVRMLTGSVNPTPQTVMRGKWWERLGSYLKSMKNWSPKDSRVISLITLLDTRTFRELHFNVKVRGRTMSAASYISYKLAFIFVMVPVFKDFISAAWDTAFLNYEYSEEELDKIFEGKDRERIATTFVTLLNKELADTYRTENIDNLLWEWSPLVDLFLSYKDTSTGKDTILSELDKKTAEERKELKSFFGKFKDKMKVFMKWWNDNGGDEVVDTNNTQTPSPTPTATATATQPTPLPPPPSDTNLASEDISSAEVDSFIDTYLSDIKDIIVKPYTVNSDKTISLYQSGQDTPIGTITKVGGKLTMK